MIWFCIHKWHPAAVYHYLDTSYNDNGIPSTRVTSRCVKCGKLHVAAHYGVGHLNLEALHAVPMIKGK